MDTTTVVTVDAQTEGNEPINAETHEAEAFIGPVLPAETTALAVVEPSVEPQLAGTDPIAEAIEAALAPVVIPDDIAAMLARLDSRNLNIAAVEHGVRVLQYERKRPPVSRIGRDSRSERPMCGGCGYGIRKETRKVDGPNGVYHPNCAKVAAGAADAAKISPRYLAAIVPLTQARFADLSQNALPAPVADAPVEVEVPTTEGEPAEETEGTPEVVDHVEEAVKESGKNKKGRKNRAS